MGKLIRYIKDAVDTGKMKIDTAKQNKQTSRMQEQLGISKALKRYSDKYGEEMTPSRRRDAFQGGLLDKKQRDYENMRKEEISKAKQIGKTK
jgi:hypothetical protein